MGFLVQTRNDLVFERINPKVFERCFQRWVQSIVETLGAQVIPIDGKTLKGSYDREQGKSALPPRQRMGKRASPCFRTSQSSR